MALRDMRTWEGIGFKSVSEPTDLVDSLLWDNLTLCEAAECQVTIFKRPFVSNPSTWDHEISKYPRLSLIFAQSSASGKAGIFSAIGCHFLASSALMAINSC